MANEVHSQGGRRYAGWTPAAELIVIRRFDMTKRPLFRFLEYRPATEASRVLVDAIHAAPPKADRYTGEIVKAVAKHTGCHCIVAKVSRTKADINRPAARSGNPEAVAEYRATIASLLEATGLLDDRRQVIRPFLHIAVHGMTDDHDLDVELGTRHKRTCSPSVHDWVFDHLKQWASKFDPRRVPRVGANQHFRGDESKAFHRLGDGSGYAGYGPNFHTIQIEFAHWLRSKHRASVVDFLSGLVMAFGREKAARWTSA